MKPGVAELYAGTAAVPVTVARAQPGEGVRGRGLGKLRCAVSGGAAGQAGAGMFKALVWLGVLLLFFYICWMIVPIYITNYQFQDSMRNEAHFAVVERKDQHQVQAAIYRTAGELGLPVREDEIVVEPIAGGYRISVHYSVPLQILYYQFRLHLNPTADSNSV
jgi:hypothetical protein